MIDSKIDFKMVPTEWALCQQAGCHRAGECLRHQAFLQVPDSIKKWNCILPSAVDNGECRYYQSSEKIRVARGFRQIVSRLKSRDARHDIRITLTDYFGSKGTYYRRRDGEQPLTPDQQQFIRNLLARYGYTEGIEFDEYSETFDFTQI